jgi:23S rRNA (guanosine2251-2'-O)-methyltransferase
VASERIHGLHAVRAVLERSPGRVRGLFLQRGREDARVAALESLARTAGVPVQRVDASQLKGWTHDAVHQGVVAEVESLAPMDEDTFYTLLAANPTALVLALDGVQDPHNLGACLRTADACGVLAVVVPRDRAATLNATARKAATGAAETKPLVTVTNLSRALQLIKDAGLWVVGAEAGAMHRAQDVDLTGGRCLVLGAEGRGLRELTRRSCDWLVSLPSLGSVESLNVSVATGMLLYEALRQRGIPKPAPDSNAGPAARGG